MLFASIEVGSVEGGIGPGSSCDTVGSGGHQVPSWSLEVDGGAGAGVALRNGALAGLDACAGGSMDCCLVLEAVSEGGVDLAVHGGAG